MKAKTNQEAESGRRVQTPDLSPWPVLAGHKRAFHAMIKPTGAICNLDCTYCYYTHKAALLGSNRGFQISDEILEAHIRQYIEGQDREEVVFSWQGGEPTLLGLEFFEKVVRLSRSTKSHINASRMICRQTVRC